jgi:hypothetical protein
MEYVPKIELKQCFECKYPYYLSVKDGDKNPINCSANAPVEYYYPKNQSYFYRCITNCRICKNDYQCYQRDPEFRLNDKTQCVERIEGCGIMTIALIQLILTKIPIIIVRDTEYRTCRMQ